MFLYEKLSHVCHSQFLFLLFKRSPNVKNMAAVSTGFCGASLQGRQIPLFQVGWAADSRPIICWQIQEVWEQYKIYNSNSISFIYIYIHLLCVYIHITMLKLIYVYDGTGKPAHKWYRRTNLCQEVAKRWCWTSQLSPTSSLPWPGCQGIDPSCFPGKTEVMMMMIIIIINIINNNNRIFQHWWYHIKKERQTAIPLRLTARRRLRCVFAMPPVRLGDIHFTPQLLGDGMRLLAVFDPHSGYGQNTAMCTRW